jgi:hypothetical protein
MICETKEAGSQTYYRFSEERMLCWLIAKVGRTTALIRRAVWCIKSLTLALQVGRLVGSGRFEKADAVCRISGRPVPRTVLEHRVSEKVDSDACPRPTAGRPRGAVRLRDADSGRGRGRPAPLASRFHRVSQPLPIEFA